MHLPAPVLHPTPPSHVANATDCRKQKTNTSGADGYDGKNETRRINTEKKNERKTDERQKLHSVQLLQAACHPSVVVVVVVVVIVSSTELPVNTAVPRCRSLGHKTRK